MFWVPSYEGPRGPGALVLAFTHCLPTGWSALISLAFKSEKKKGFFPSFKSRDEIKFGRGETAQDEGSPAAAAWSVISQVKTHLALRSPVTGELVAIKGHFSYCGKMYIA